MKKTIKVSNPCHSTTKNIADYGNLLVDEYAKRADSLKNKGKGIGRKEREEWDEWAQYPNKS